MNYLQILIGAGLLAVGRRLFWLFVAGVGFLFGMRLVAGMFASAPVWLQIAVGLIIGIAGAAAAILVQRLGVAVAGFLAGMLIAVTLLDGFDIAGGSALWIATLLAGILGAVLFNLMFDWALIALSSLAGAIVIAQSIQLPTGASLVVAVILFVVGFAIQGGFIRRRGPSSG